MAIARVLATDEMHEPKGFQREASTQAVRVSWRGPGHGACTAAGLSGLLLSALLLAGLAAGTRDAGGLVVVFAIPAAISAYVLLVGLFDRTVLTLETHRIAARQGPLPCPWPARFQAERPWKLAPLDVYKVWVEEAPASSSRDGRQASYGLAVMTISGGRELLLTRLTLKDAAYLEQELTEFIGLEN